MRTICELTANLLDAENKFPGAALPGSEEREVQNALYFPALSNLSAASYQILSQSKATMLMKCDFIIKIEIQNDELTKKNLFTNVRQTLTDKLENL